MENKINIAKLLKDCPSGMELDCTMYDNLYFNSVNADYYATINCYTLIDGIKTSINFTKYGTFNNHIGAKCVIFPKGKTTWEGFQRPFKDGDIIVVKTYKDIIFYSIYKDIENREVLTYADYALNDNRLINVNNTLCYTCEIIEQRLATEEEKEKLFRAIKDNGYYWNTETKTLERLAEPRFKVGDRIKAIINNNQYVIKELTDTHYTLVEVEHKFKYTQPISEDKNWELVPNKFDITTLKPFDKVLVRFNSSDCWHIQYFEKYDKGEQYCPFICLCTFKYEQCIPYENNQHLLDTANDCNDFYKTWE